MNESPLYLKSIISQNTDISYICYLYTHYQSHKCDCLTYNLNSKEFEISLCKDITYQSPISKNKASLDLKKDSRYNALYRLWCEKWF